jgi:peroxiredoxin
MQIIIVLFIAGLCIANWLLIKQNQELKATIAGMGNKPPNLLKPGQQVPPLAARVLSGQRQEVNYADSAMTVLLAFSTQCPSCEQVLPYWREIKAACARNQYQVFGINLDDSSKTRTFLGSSGLDIETFVDIDNETREGYKLSLAPQTIVIDSRGRVERIWPGNFSQETKQEVERYFGISVPGESK